MKGNRHCILIGGVILAILAATLTSCRSTHGWTPLRKEPLNEPRLHEVFLEARAIMEQPYVPSGENSEGVSFALRDQMILVGDKRFAASLAKEPPDVVAAVGDFVSKPWMGRRTEELIKNAGHFDFPASRAEEAEKRRSESVKP